MTRIIRSLIAVMLIVTAARAADTYKLDPAHTTVGFSISHLIISEVNGRFDDVTGDVTLDKDAVTAAKATIQAKSIDTNIKKRDDHLRSPDFFDVEKFPTIAFVGEKVEKDGDKTVLTGKFTLHGVTKDIRLPFTAKGPIKDPWGNSRLALKAETTINRADYGMKPFTGVGDEVEIKITAEATKAEDKK
jgi:polyisoprenoid-binding protein YceI